MVIYEQVQFLGSCQADITQSSGNRQAVVGSSQASQFSSNHKAFGRQSSDVQAIQMSYDRQGLSFIAQPI